MADLTVEQMLSELPAGWSMWQAAMGHYVVEIRDESQIIHFSADTIAEAVRQAHEYKPLPVVPRKPMPFFASEWTPKKRGNRWSPYSTVKGASLECFLNTKKDCQAFIDRMASRQKNEIEEWDQKYGKMVANGIEGETFRYKV